MCITATAVTNSAGTVKQCFHVIRNAERRLLAIIIIIIIIFKFDDTPAVRY